MQINDSDNIEVVEALKQDSLGEFEADIRANRWQKHGHDRVYLNDDSKLDKYGYYLDLETMEPGEKVSKSTYADGTDVTVDGDTVTLEIVDRWEITLRVA